MRYLSSLEHTEKNIGSNTLGCCGGFLLALLAVVWGIFAGFSAAVWLVVAAAMAMGILSGYLSSETVRTSPEGIICERPLRRKFIAWNDVVDAHTFAEQRSHFAEITSSTTRIRLPLYIDEYNALIEASVWQHLHKHGKADNYTPSDDVLSIWADIPDSIPREMDYYHEKIHHDRPTTHYQLRENFISEEATDETEDAALLDDRSDNKSVIYWSDVNKIEWDSEYNFLDLWIHTASREMYVMDRTNLTQHQTDIDSARFLLAVIRRAREIESEPAIVIPEHMRKACGIEV